MKFFYNIFIFGFFALLVNSVKSSEDGHKASAGEADPEPGVKVEEHKDHDAPKWGYNIVDSHDSPLGTDQWAKLLPDKCGTQLKRQSPIDFVSSKVKYDSALAANHIDLLIKTPNKTRTLSMYNNGHSVAVMFLNTHVFVQGGGLGDVFRVAGLHFHWGGDSNRGSEHRVDGKMYPLEMHIVNYDTERYLGLGDAVTTGENSLAVLGVFFKEVKEDNPALNVIFDNLHRVIQPSHGPAGGIQISYFDLRTLLPSNTRNFYRYLGSLTTPTCNEIVVWTVFETPLTVSKAQLDKLRGLVEYGNINLYNNYRPPQPLNGRVIKASFVPKQQLKQIRKQELEKAAKASSGDNAAPGIVASSILVMALSLLATL